MLPAYAGMIRGGAVDGDALGCAPRVCGDDPGTLSLAGLSKTCSPRMRG